MIGIKDVAFLVVLTFLQSLARTDAVNCVFNESCILPCSFQVGDGVLIHWYKGTARKILVHSYYKKEDQNEHQDQQFRGRTSLFKDQISRGNASLQLTRVKIQDEGKYEYYVSVSTFGREAEHLVIDLKVDAPVRKVNIQQVNNMMTCRSEGIYPEPELTWSTDPPSTVTPQENPTVHQTEQQLYNIRSSLTVSRSDLDYSCTVSTKSNKRRTTLFKPASISGSQTETTIRCRSSDAPLTDLIWRFNHSQIILTQTGANDPYRVSKEWTQQVKSLSESGSLTLKDLSSSQEGIYSCELSDAEETYITNTALRIIEDSPNHVAGIVGGVVGAVGLIGVVGLVAFFIYKEIKRRRKEGENPPPPESVPLRDVAPNGGGQ